jgi:hypothetical protein
MACQIDAAIGAPGVKNTDKTQMLLRWLQRIFGPSTTSSVFEPLIADWQREWTDAKNSALRTRVRSACSG